MIWSDAMIEDLRRLWSAGYSASQIGRQVGKTRNAVLGMRYRLDLPHREIVFRTRGGAPRAPSKRPMVNPPTPMRKTVSTIIRDGTPIPSPQETDIPRIATNDLEAHHCRWSCVADPRETPPHAPQFCGRPRIPGVSYCISHVRRAFAIPPPKRAVSTGAEPTRILEHA